MKSIVIIPAYNEEKQIRRTVDEVRSAGYWDVAVVDDGSADMTALAARQAGAIVLTHAINRGQGAAIRTGMLFASRRGYEAAVFFDADGQMSAGEIAPMLAKLFEGNDVVLGSRNLGRAVDMPLTRRLIKTLSLIFTRLTTGLKVTDTHIGFQAWRMAAWSKITLRQDRMAHASELLAEIARHGLKYCELPVTIHYTEYSKRKGQKLSGIFSILWDLLIK